MRVWRTTIEESFDEAGITATKEQIDIVTNWVEGLHENYGLYTGQDCIPHPATTENVALKKELEIERNKIICEECKGKGVTHSYGGTFMSTSSCSRCRGEGRHKP